MATYRSLSGWCTKSKPFNGVKRARKQTSRIVWQPRQIRIFTDPHSAFLPLACTTTEIKNYEHNSHCKQTLNALFWLCLILHVITLYHSVSLFYVQFYLCVIFIWIYSAGPSLECVCVCVSGGKKRTIPWACFFHSSRNGYGCCCCSEVAFRLSIRIKICEFDNEPILKWSFGHCMASII